VWVAQEVGERGSCWWAVSVLKCLFKCCAKDVGGNGKGQFKGWLESWVGSRKVGGGWFQRSFVVVIIGEVVSKWAEWESSHVFVQKELDLLGRCLGRSTGGSKAWRSQHPDGPLQGLFLMGQAGQEEEK
jgi:hypothetical protein